MAHVDPWDDPNAKLWAKGVLAHMAPQLADSACSISIVPDDEGDVKFWVELGASIMMDKPLIVCVFNDRAVPPKLELVADEIVRLPSGIDAAASVEFREALLRVMKKLGR